MRSAAIAILCVIASHASAASLGGVWAYVSGTPSGQLPGLWRVEAQTGSYDLVALGDFQDFDLSPDSRTAYVLDEGVVEAIDVATGQVSTLSSGGLLANPTRIAVRSDGTVYVIDGGLGSGWSVLEIDAGTGGQSLVTADGIRSRRYAQPGSLVDGVEEVTFTSDDRLMVAAWYQSAVDDEVLSIDLETGEETLLYFEENSGGMTGLGADRMGNAYVAFGRTNGSQIVRIDSSGSASVIGSVDGLMPGADLPLTSDEIFTTLLNDVDALDPQTLFLTAHCCGGGPDPDFDGDGTIDGSGLYHLSVVDVLRPASPPIFLGSFGEVKLVAAAVPEPRSVLLLLAGVLLVGVRARRSALHGAGSDLAAGWHRLLARDVPLAFGVALLGMITGPRWTGGSPRPRPGSRP
jgi:hypothetical protein